MEHMNLLGAEAVERAGTRMAYAAEEMSRAAELIAQVAHTLLVRIEALEEAIRESTGELAVHAAALGVLTEVLQPPKPIVVPARGLPTFPVAEPGEIIRMGRLLPEMPASCPGCGKGSADLEMWYLPEPELANVYGAPSVWLCDTCHDTRARTLAETPEKLVSFEADLQMSGGERVHAPIVSKPPT